MNGYFMVDSYYWHRGEGGIVMQQKKKTNHMEALSIEEYLTKRKRVKDMEESQRQGGIPKENQALVLAGLYI